MHGAIADDAHVVVLPERAPLVQGDGEDGEEGGLGYQLGQKRVNGTCVMARNACRRHAFREVVLLWLACGRERRRVRDMNALSAEEQKQRGAEKHQRVNGAHDGELSRVAREDGPI